MTAPTRQYSRRTHYLNADIAQPFKSEGNRCPTCKRILLATRTGFWPLHINTATQDRRWCKRSDTPYPKAVTA